MPSADFCLITGTIADTRADRKKTDRL